MKRRPNAPTVISDRVEKEGTYEKEVAYSDACVACRWRKAAGSLQRRFRNVTVFWQPSDKTRCLSVLERYAYFIPMSVAPNAAVGSKAEMACDRTTTP